MKKIRIFICASHKDSVVAEIIRATLADCYGFDAFFFDHSLVGSQDYHKEIVTHLDRCEIFLPLLSVNFRQSSFCNQEVGFAVRRQLKEQVKIYPISIDKTQSYDLIDHIQVTLCERSVNYSELKATTSFFNTIVSHRDFTQFQRRAVENMLEVLIKTDNWKAISTILYTLDVTKNKVTLTSQQIKKIRDAIEKNPSIPKYPVLKNKLRSFLKEKYNVTVA